MPKPVTPDLDAMRRCYGLPPYEELTVNVGWLEIRTDLLVLLAHIEELRAALRTACKARCDNRKCDWCETYHEDQPSEAALRRAAELVPEEAK